MLFRSITQVTARSTATDPVITISPAILATNTPPGYTDGDGLRITIVARLQDAVSRCSQLAKKINVYSFALKPEEHQPSGTCNFSRIDNAKLITNVADSLNVYAVNYNVLRVMSGMGGLAYSN